MTKERRLSLSPTTGFSIEIGRFVTMMADLRRRTIEYVEGLSPEHLAWFPNDKVESIGTQLLHIAAVECSYIQEDIERKPMGEEWKTAFPLRSGIPQVFGKELGYFLDKLVAVGAGTLEVLRKLSDEDLKRELIPLEPGPGNEDVCFTVEWLLYHLIEHEAHHKGQIALMKRLLPRSQVQKDNE